MKKKLLTILAVFGCVGGSFSEEPPSSPFQESPFGAPASFDVEHKEEANPFITPPSAGPSPFEESGRSEAPRKEQELFRQPEVNSVFPLSEESPFGNARDVGRQGEISQPTFERPSVLAPLPIQSQQHPISLFGSEQEKSEAVSNATFDQNNSPEEEQAMWEPAPDMPEKGQTVSKEDEAIEGEIDTFERQGSGNWLLKRVWWEKTEPVYEQIKQVFNDIMNARMDFISQRNRLDRELDVAYGQIGLEEGELQDMLDHCLNIAKQEKKEQGFLTKEEEMLYNTLQHKQNDLEQIKLDVKALQEVDQKIDEALEALFKQIDIANQYEQKAWENFKEIARELNDKIARKSYYETEGLLKDIQNVHSYITGEFSNYFSQTLQSARSHSQNISSQVHALKQAGVDLKQQMETLERTQEAERVKKEIAEHDKEFESAEKKKLEQKTKAVQAQGMLNQMVFHVKDAWLHFVDRVLHGFSQVISRVKGWFGKEETALTNREKALELKVSQEEKKINNELTHEQKNIQKDEQGVEKEEHAAQAYQSEGRQYKEENQPTHKNTLESHHSSETTNPFRVETSVSQKPSVMPKPTDRSDDHVEHSRNVSVMPREPKNPVSVFGPPPVENHTSENPFVQESAGPALPPPSLPKIGGHPISPFVG